MPWSPGARSTRTPRNAPRLEQEFISRLRARSVPSPTSGGLCARTHRVSRGSDRAKPTRIAAAIEAEPQLERARHCTAELNLVRASRYSQRHLHDRCLGKHAFERLVGFFGELGIELAELGRLRRRNPRRRTSDIRSAPPSPFRRSWRHIAFPRRRWSLRPISSNSRRPLSRWPEHSCSRRRRRHRHVHAVLAELLHLSVVMMILPGDRRCR